MIITKKKKKAMQEAIDYAWENPEGAELRAQLFPDGKPEPEEFIKTIAEHVKQNRKTLKK